MGIGSTHLIGSRSFLLVAAFMAALAARPASADFNGKLPIGKGQILSRFGGTPPQYSTLFNDRYSPGAAVYWDPLLDTPRYVSPRDRISLIEYPRINEENLVEACRSFIEENRDFFGAGAGDLISPTVHDVDQSWLIAFEEAAGGIPIRGANIRILLTGSGTLESIKAFLLRDPPGREYSFTPFEPIASRLAQWNVTIEDSERELYFPRHSTSSLTPVWYVRGVDAESQPWEYFFDPATGDLRETRIIAWELGWIEGKVTGNYPDPDDPYKDVKQISVTPRGDDIARPLPGALIEELNGGRLEPVTCDDTGSFSIEVPGDPMVATTLKCSTEYSRKGADLPAPLGSSWSSGFNSLLRVLVPDHDSCDPRDRYSFPLINKSEPLLAGQLWNVLFKGERDEEDHRQINSGALMAFTHILRFMNDTFPRFERYNLHFRQYFPLTFIVPKIATRRREYVPCQTCAHICFSTVILQDDKFPDGEEQVMTPTMINHEYAHHLIYILTGALESKGFDCKMPKDLTCIQEDKDPSIVREGQVVEGIADALAAYKAGIPQFGYYEPRPEARGWLAYDISDILETGIPRDRLEVAKALWDLYKKFEENGKEQKAIDLIYRWLSRNNPPQGEVNRIFDGSMSLMEELLDVLDCDDFTEESDCDRTTVSSFDRWVKEAFAERKFFYGMFVRGDADQNALIDINDPVFILRYEFDGGIEGKCLDAMDADGDNTISITDPIFLLRWLFTGGDMPPEPFPVCGIDGDPFDDPFSCWDPTCEY